MDKDVLVAFSGGVDSTVLAALAKDSAKKVILLTVTSEVVSDDEVRRASTVAKELDLPLEVAAFDWLKHENLSSNPADRCYTCKKAMAAIWKEKAEEMKLSLVVEGTTASELSGYRPGGKALEEAEITSPFLEAGMTKTDIRDYAREKNLSNAEAPSMACLATRFAYGTEITPDLLKKIHQVEGIVKSTFNVECVRARYQDGTIRIEVAKPEMSNLQAWKFSGLAKAVKRLGFRYVTLDLEGYRTGSMDEGM